jgi:tetratricopeptide (TPR) repeat protein
LLRYQPRNPLLWFNLGNARRDQGRLDDAIRCFRAAVDIDPSWTDARNSSGSALHTPLRFARLLNAAGARVRCLPHPKPKGDLLRRHGEAIAQYLDEDSLDRDAEPLLIGDCPALCEGVVSRRTRRRRHGISTIRHHSRSARPSRCWPQCGIDYAIAARRLISR